MNATPTTTKETETMTYDDAAQRCNLVADDSNAEPHPGKRSVWYWGPLSSCRRMAAVLGWDTMRASKSSYDMRDQRGVWVGFIGTHDGPCWRIGSLGNTWGIRIGVGS